LSRWKALCFGEQIGWFVPTIVDEADKFPFQRNVVRLRYSPEGIEKELEIDVLNREINIPAEGVFAWEILPF
jgi:hypothetical protein